MMNEDSLLLIHHSSFIVHLFSPFIFHQLEAGEEAPHLGARIRAFRVGVGFL
jgi:hypothetical protein